MKAFSASIKTALVLLLLLQFASGVCAKPVEWHYDPVGTFGLLTMNHSNLFNMYTIIDQASATGFIDDDKFTDSRFEIRAKVSSFYVHPAPTIEQLQSKDFFYDEKFPEIVLRTVAIHETGGEYSATVELTIRGVTRKEIFGLEVSKKVPFEGTTWRAFRFKGSINRHDYGMTWREPEMLDDPLYGDIFELEFSAEFTDKEFAQKEGQKIVLPYIEYGKVVYPSAE